jgi:drug/metabolite transporter (DMT)-like permease
MSVLHRVATLMLMLAGGLASAYGVLILASIGSSDTDTGTLVAYGLAFAVPGIAAIAAGTWLLHRHRTRT